MVRVSASIITTAPAPCMRRVSAARLVARVVVSGCSHSGICNICEAAKSVTGKNLYAVIGGFHLLHNEEPPVDETIVWFKAERPEILLPMHCVDFDILARFHAELGTRKLGAGDVIEL